MIKAIAIVCLILLVHQSCSFDYAKLVESMSKIKKDWVSGHNTYFEGKSEQFVRKLMGTLPTDPKDRLPERKIEALQNIPESFDSREFWPKCQSIKEVRDQSTCGSCWAFAAVEAMSDRICIESGQRSQVRLSTRDLLSCCGKLECGLGCDGGMPHGAWKYFKNTGIVEEACQPYPFPKCDHHTTGQYEPCGKIQPTPSCEKKCVSSELDYKKDLHTGKMIYSVPSKMEDIQTEILTNGPVEASFEVYEDFLTYKSGVYSHTKGGKGLGGHSVKIIGWGVENSTPYWLIANSWNEDWGDKGFFKIKRGSNECGIEKEVIAGIPYISNNSYLQVE